MLLLFSYIDSPLYQCLQTQQLDPVKHDDLVLKEEKISTVKSLLNFTQVSTSIYVILRKNIFFFVDQCKNFLLKYFMHYIVA